MILCNSYKLNMLSAETTYILRAKPVIIFTKYWLNIMSAAVRELF